MEASVRILLLIWMGIVHSLGAGALSSLAPKRKLTPPVDFHIQDTLRERLEELEELSRCFYLDPSEERATRILDLTYLSGKMEPAHSLLLFAFYEMFQASPAVVSKAVAKLEVMDAPGRAFLLILLKALDYPDFEKLLEHHEDSLPANFRRVLQDPGIVSPPSIPEMEVRSPEGLDLFWAHYFMTGETRILDKVVKIIENGDFKEDHLVAAAYWGLGSIAVRDTRALKHLVQYSRESLEAIDEIRTLVVHALIQRERGSKAQKGEEKAWFLHLRSRTDVDSQIKLAACYFNGTGVEPDEGKAREILLRHVGKSEGEAEVVLAAMAYQNQGFLAGKTIIEWLEASVAQGNQKGMVSLIQKKLYSEEENSRQQGWAFMSEGISAQGTEVLLLAASEYRLGVTTEQNYPEAIRIYEKLKQERHPRAVYELARIYGHSDERRRDFVKARGLLEEACSLIIPHACLILNRNESGEGPWFEGFRVQQERGEIEAVYRLGIRLYTGESVEKDPVEGKKLLSQAVSEGHAMAANDLAYTMALEGEDLDECLRLAHLAWEKIRAIGEASEKSAVLDTLAWIAYLKKDYHSAWEWIQKIPEKDRGRGEVQKHFHVIEEALGKKNLLPDLR